jgi:hypothetical protein
MSCLKQYLPVTKDAGDYFVPKLTPALLSPPCRQGLSQVKSTGKSSFQKRNRRILLINKSL